MLRLHAELFLGERKGVLVINVFSFQRTSLDSGGSTVSKERLCSKATHTRCIACLHGPLSCNVFHHSLC